MGKNIDKRVWGVLGKQQTYFSPQKQVEGKTKTPLNANAFDSWDAKRSRFKRVDGYENAVQQGGVVPQQTSGPAVSPTPTPTITQTQTQTSTPTPSITPTFTPTPSSTPYPLPLNPTIWYDASDSSTLTLISSGGTNYVSAWQSKGTTTWSLSGANTDTMPVLSASTLMPGNPNIVRFTTNATTSLRDYLVSFNNTPIGHTGSTIFQVWAKPSGSTYATALSSTRVYSGLTNGGTATSFGVIDQQNTITALNGALSSIQTYSTNSSGTTAALLVPVYSAAALNDKFIFQVRTPFTAGQFSTFELNQSGGTGANAFSGTTVIPSINSFSIGITSITTGGTITTTNQNIELCEIMYFDTVLTNAQVEQVELYLKDKWRYDEWASPVPTPTQTSSPTTTPTKTLTPTPSTTPPFNPITLNPMIWVDFNDTATLSLRSGQFVQSVSNKGNWTAFTGFSQTTAANQPSWSASTMGTGMSAITISNDFLQSTTSITGSAWNTVIVLKFSGTNVFQPIKITGTITGQNSAWSNIYADRSNSRYANFFVQFSSDYRAGFTPFTGWTSGHIVQSYMSNSALTIVDYFTVNNSAQTETNISNSVISTGAPGNMVSNQFRIVNEDGIYSDIPGEIGEMYMFNKELTSTEQTNLINFLKTKWGIA